MGYIVPRTYSEKVGLIALRKRGKEGKRREKEGKRRKKGKKEKKEKKTLKK